MAEQTINPLAPARGGFRDGQRTRRCARFQGFGGGDIEKMLNKRAIIGAFPWRYEGLEACPCRIVCFEGMDENVEAVGDVARAIYQRR